MVAASCSRLPFPLLRVSMQVTPEPVRSFRSPPGRGRIQTPAQMLYPTKIPSPDPGMGMEQGGSWAGWAGQRDRGTEGPTPRQVAQRRIWDRGRDSTGPARTHRTRARRDRRAWRASVAAGPAAAWHGAAGPVGTEGHKVPCRGWGRGSPPWQERCGETGAGAAGQHRGHPTDPPAPAFTQGDPRTEPLLQHGSHAPTPSPISKTLPWQRPHPARVMAALFWPGSIFWQPASNLPRSSGFLSGPQGHQGPPPALKPGPVSGVFVPWAGGGLGPRGPRGRGSQAHSTQLSAWSPQSPPPSRFWPPLARHRCSPLASCLPNYCRWAAINKALRTVVLLGAGNWRKFPLGTKIRGT